MLAALSLKTVEENSVFVFSPSWKRLLLRLKDHNLFVLRDLCRVFGSCGGGFIRVRSLSQAIHCPFSSRGRQIHFTSFTFALTTRVSSFRFVGIPFSYTDIAVLCQGFVLGTHSLNKYINLKVAAYSLTVITLNTIYFPENTEN